MKSDDIIDDHLPSDYGDITLPYATRGQRFTNFLIDYFFKFILTVFIAILVVMVILDDSAFESLAEMGRLGEIILGSITSLIYYSLFEYLTDGKSIGKYITKTRAVKNDGTPMDFATTMTRTLCRLIPFDALSYLGNKKSGWHDRFSDTIVIKDAGWKDWQKQNREID